MRRSFLTLVLTIWTVSPARAGEPPPTPRVAVMDLQTHGVPEETGTTLNGVLLSGLAEGGGIDLIGKADLGSLLSLEQTKQLLGCPPQDPRCAVQHGQALGKAVLVWGTVGKVGNRMVITVAAVDIQAGTSLGRGSRSVDPNDGEEMILATRQLAAELRANLGLESRATWTPTLAVSLRAGGFLSAYLSGEGSIDPLLAAFELEAGYFVLPQLQIYLQVGVNLGRGEQDDREYDAVFLPAALGVKYRWIRPWVVPYTGLGLGLGFLDLNNQGGAFSLHLMAGIELNPWERVGFCLEGGFNFSEYFSTKNFTQLGGKAHLGVIYRF